jgi:heat shock protein 5
MVAEAEEFAEQDKAVKGKIDARNKLETYCYNMKTTLSEKLGEKLDEEDKETVNSFATSFAAHLLLYLQIFHV